MICYQGDWIDDERCGEGEFRYNTGETYNGRWREDKQSMCDIRQMKNGQNLKLDFFYSLAAGPFLTIAFHRVDIYI